MLLEEKRNALIKFFKEENCGHGDCKMKAVCGAGCDKFAGPRDPEFGADYGKEGLLQIAVVSLDAGDLQSCQDVNHTMKISGKLHKAQHWYRTLELVELLQRKSPVDYDNNQKSQEKKIINAINTFVHLNSARCCQNKTHNAQADQHLFDNCRPFVAKELEILLPDVLITQGSAAWPVANEFPARCKKVLSVEGKLTVTYRDICGKIVPHIHLYHPNYWSGFNKQRNAYIATPSLLWEAVRNIPDLEN